jgi:hypothetical protein
MELDRQGFNRGIREQTAWHLRLTPAERFQALWDLLAAEHELAKRDPEVRARIERRLAESERDRERHRVHVKYMLETGKAMPCLPEARAGPMTSHAPPDRA